MYFDFKTAEAEKIKIKFALSSVSQQNALENMQSEIKDWDFENVKSNAQKLWNTELNKITIEASEDTKVNFYTAMYQDRKSVV